MLINKVSHKTIVSIFIILLLFIIMSVSSLAWDGYSNTPSWEGYPNTPYNELYDDSYIYQVISINTGKPCLSVSDTPFYMYTLPYGKRIDTSSGIHSYFYDNGNWEYWDHHTQGQQFTQIFESTHDIYTNSSLTEVFFSATLPMPMPPIQETLTQHPPLTLMKSRLVGLIPLLIGLLIVSVGFYKGLSALSKALRQA